MNKDIGVGVAGLGLGALLLRINEDASSRMKIRGVFEPDTKRQFQRYDQDKDLPTLAKQFGVDLLTSSYAELLARRDIDVIAIFSPCPFHHEQIASALKAGKHVIVTKPMVTSLDQAREIVRLVESTGRKLLVAQSMRWNSMFLAIRRLFDEGKLGRIHLAEAYYLHDMRPVLDRSPWRWQMPQDFMYGGACHPIDLLRWFVGEIEEVFCYGTHGPLEKRYPAGKMDNFIISLKHRGGVTSRVMAAYDLVHPPGLWRDPHFHGVGIGLYGDKASLFNDRVVYDYRGAGEPREELVQPLSQSTNHGGEALAFMRHFEDCLVSGAKPLVDHRDGAQVIATCAACWESIETGRPAKVTREFDV